MIPQTKARIVYAEMGKLREGCDRGLQGHDKAKELDDDHARGTL